MVEFVTSNNPDDDYNLVREAWVDDTQIADLRKTGAGWILTVFSDVPQLELALQTWEEIVADFRRFAQQDPER